MNRQALKLAIQSAAPAGWQKMDLTLLAADTVRPPQLTNQLPPRLMAWCQEMAGERACPVDYVAGSFMAFASAAIGNSRWARPNASWTEPPQLWLGLIGGPSWGKTPAMKPFSDAAAELELDDEPTWKETLVAHERDSEHAKAKQEAWRQEVREATKAGSAPPDMPLSAMPPDRPVRPRLRISDATTPEIGSILAGNPRGLLQVRDELSGWLGSMDQYGGNGADRAFYLETWNGGGYTIDRRKFEGHPIRIAHASLAIMGGLQPDKLREALAGADDELAARFIFLWPSPAPYRDLNAPNTTLDLAAHRRSALLLSTARKLRGLKMGQNDRGELVPVMRGLDDGAFKCLNEIRCNADARAKAAKGLAAGWHGKTPARALRVALVLELLTWAMSEGSDPEPGCITARSMVHAAEYLDYAADMLERVLGGLVIDEAEADAAHIGRMLIQEKATTLNERDLYQRAGFTYLRDAQRRRAAFEALAGAAFIQPVAPQGNHRPRADWMVNPAVRSAA